MPTIESAASLPSSFASLLPSLGVVRLGGEERVKYLQGQVTADLHQLHPDHAMLACHCDFKGKTWSDFYTLIWQNDLHLSMDRSAMTASLKELQKYGVFAKVEIQDACADWVMVGGRGDAFTKWLSTIFASLPESHLQVSSNDKGWVMSLGNGERFLVALAATEADSLKASFDGEWADEVAWQLLQIQAGVGNISAATQSEYVPQMINMHALGAISFTKGCYMGQETVARTKYLGKNKRAAFILKSNQPAQIAAGDDLEIALGENWRRAGQVISVANLGQESWLMAVLANDTEADAQLRVKSAPDVLLSLQPLPYSIDE